MKALTRRNLKYLLAILCLGGLFVVLVPAGRVHGKTKAPKGAKYTSAKKCKKCHFKQYKTWSKMKHAGAWENLPTTDKKREECVKCHVTGYGKPGGYVSEAKTPELTAVQCDACHGPSSKHIEVAQAEEEKATPNKAAINAGIDRIPDNTCVGCHNPHKKHDEYNEK